MKADNRIILSPYLPQPFFNNLFRLTDFDCGRLFDAFNPVIYKSVFTLSNVRPYEFTVGMGAWTATAFKLTLDED
ncbi:MAG TPA: hypothetical protein PLQ35_09830 [bacterium]|nr:hypothetical protein [bacterium]HQL62582.1 hypothetical protein [bacterium]